LPKAHDARARRAAGVPLPLRQPAPGADAHVFRRGRASAAGIRRLARLTQELRRDEHEPMLAGDLAGKRAVITGAGRGIGRGIASRLAGEGVAVAIGDVSTAAADETAGEIREHGGTALSVPMDV